MKFAIGMLIMGFFGLVAGGAIMRESIATDCKDRGHVVLRDRVYECHLRQGEE